MSWISLVVKSNERRCWRSNSSSSSLVYNFPASVPMTELPSAVPFAFIIPQNAVCHNVSSNSKCVTSSPKRNNSFNFSSALLIHNSFVKPSIPGRVTSSTCFLASRDLNEICPMTGRFLGDRIWGTISPFLLVVMILAAVVWPRCNW